MKQPIVLNLEVQIDGKIKDGEVYDPRRHLGASQIGKECARQIWYHWRWACKVEFEGRMLRLFKRGHNEEAKFIDLLKMIGIEVEDVDPATVHSLWWHDGSDCYFVVPPDGQLPERAGFECDDVTGLQSHMDRAKARGIVLPEPRQHGFKAIGGHFAGSMDGKTWGLQNLEQYGILPTTVGVGEFKTFNVKRFDELVSKGVETCKPEHYAQMQTYMRAKGLPFALYCAICKNDDRLYFELVLYDDSAACGAYIKADGIIRATAPPPRAAPRPTFPVCKFCDFKLICHYGVPMAQNCRTCRFSQVTDNARWNCTKWGKLIPQEAEINGCPSWQQISD